ncbi:MAG: MFS transporter [Armatimonadota bacterium]|nr:MFS transporter [Armatimonadota bacterium]
MLEDSQWLSHDALLLSLSAFFADLGYQGVTALYPLFLVLELHKSPLLYGLISGLGFGVGSLFAFVGGWLGDRLPKKPIIIIGNLGILLLAFSGLSSTAWISGLLFVAGWWFRYLRTPPRRALLAQVTDQRFRTKVFGFLHALDIGGGLISVIAAITLLILHVSARHIIIFAAIPLTVSTLVLLPVGKSVLYPVEWKPEELDTVDQTRVNRRQRRMFVAILVAASLYGFSFYNLGFPVLSAAVISRTSVAGVAAYGLYLGISAISGWLLGLANMRGLRPLWRWGFLPSAFASLAISVNAFLHGGAWAFYPAVAILGLGMGAVETYEPALAASLRTTGNVSSGMGWLSVARSIGQFGANFIMGTLFAIGEAYGYLFAAGTALLAAMILVVTEHGYNTQKAI